MQCHQASSSTTVIPTATGERADNRDDGGQVFLREIPDEAEVPPPPVPSGRPRAQEHLLAHGGMQHCGRPEVHEEADRSANFDDDKGDRQVGPRPGEGDMQPHAARGLQ